MLSYQPPINYDELLKGTDLESLQKVFGEVLRRKKSRRDPIRSGFGKIKREEISIDNKTLYIRAYLQAHPHTDFRALLESQESKEEVIVTFLILLELMKTLAREGMTMIVVTHEMGFAREVASRVLFIDGGKIREDKPPAEFFSNPENPRLRDFLSKVL